MRRTSSRDGEAVADTGARPHRDFAFYGRVSTEDNQDPDSSRNWQRSLADSLIAPRGGRVIEEFFDIGQSRSLPWQRRPEAVRLLAALANPKRGFDAVVIGEPHRAFFGNQFGLILPLFVHYGVQLWVPEIGGPIDPDNEAHDLVMSVFGGMSKGERNRIKLRVRTAMASQTVLEGRYLGGRPPYGYMLKDLGSHPNPAKAAGGKRLHGLTPDPVAAPVVQRIFAEFLGGAGMFAIAEGLTRDGIACPSAHDRARNRHRVGVAWSKSAVRVILTNPRYTGLQVWNKQRTDEVLVDVTDVALGHTSVMRWNPRDRWVTSAEAAHEAVIDVDDFTAVQELLERRGRSTVTPHRPHRSRHPYIFKSLVYCAVCERRMQGQHSHGVAYYRCRFPKEYASSNRVDHPRNVIMREDVLVEPLDRWLAAELAPERREHLLGVLAEQAEIGRLPGSGRTVDDSVVAACDAKLARYRAALDAGADPTLVSGWIAETQAERDRAVARLRRTSGGPAGPTAALGVDDLAGILDELGDMFTVLKEAEPDKKLELYRSLGVRVSYHPETQTVRATIDLGVHRWGLVGVGGGT